MLNDCRVLIQLTSCGEGSVTQVQSAQSQVPAIEYNRRMNTVSGVLLNNPEG